MRRSGALFGPVLALAGALLLALPPGCASQRSSSPYAPQAETARDPARAQALTLRAADLMHADPSRAEALLREALAADLYAGAAHNNLGVLLLQRGDLYGAASEFEWARKLLPGSPDPRVNLALTLELAGKAQSAEEAYTAALEVAPECVPAMQGLARLRVKNGTIDGETRAMLEAVALRGETPHWREWAMMQLSKR